MIETEIISLIGGNLIGVAFGLLMYRMANTSIKENTESNRELLVWLKSNMKRK